MAAQCRLCRAELYQYLMPNALCISMLLFNFFFFLQTISNIRNAALSFYYPGQKNWDSHASQTCSRDYAPVPRVRGCLNFFGQGSTCAKPLLQALPQALQISHPRIEAIPKNIIEELHISCGFYTRLRVCFHLSILISATNFQSKHLTKLSVARLT